MSVYETIERPTIPTVRERRAHVARHTADRQGQQERHADDSHILVKAAVTVCGAGATGAVAGILFRVAEAISAGVWMVLIGSGVAIFFGYVENRYRRAVREVGDGSEDAQLGHEQVVLVEEAEVSPRGSGDDTVCDPGTRPADAGVHGTHAFQGSVAAGPGPRVVLGTTRTQVARLRKLGSVDARQRFSLVRDGMAAHAQRVPAQFGPTTVTVLVSGQVRTLNRLG